MSVFEKIRILLRNFPVLWQMSRSYFRVKYAGSFLGIWWAVIIPLILAASINLIFSHVFGASFKNFTLFLLSGIVPWLFFSNALMETSQSFAANASIVRQNIFPRECIPLATITANFFIFILGFTILMPFFIITRPRVALMLPLFLLVSVLFLLFLAGLGLFFSVLNVFFRDITHLLSVGLMVWFWVTPVFYSIDMLAYPWRFICLVNPLSYYTAAYQQILFEGNIISWGLLVVCFTLSIASCLTGYVFFVKKEPALLKRI